MTTTESTIPPPCWTDLRDTVPEIRDELVDLWAKVENDTDLRWLVERLGGLIESAVAAGVMRYYDDEDEATAAVFYPQGWSAVAPGRWEQEVGSFEAGVAAQTDGSWPWRWNLWRRNTAGDLVLVDHGTAHTLADAQGQADRRAQRDRNWKGRP